MTIKEAVKQRHMVRKYTDKVIPANLVELLNIRIADNNEKHSRYRQCRRFWQNGETHRQQSKKSHCSCRARYG